MTVAIVTDTAASLPEDLALKEAVTVVPMWVVLGGESHLDGDVSLEDVVARAGEGVTTSGPTPGQFLAATEDADRGDGVVILTVATTMSSTHAAAQLAAAGRGERVVVVDSGTAAGAQGLVVLAAARACAAGASLAEVAAVARVAAGKVRLMATIPNLDQLARSGRVPGAAAWAGRWLGVNPVFEFRSGHPKPLRPARSRAAAMDRMVSRWRASRPAPGPASSDRLHVAALHALEPAPAEELLERVSAEVGGDGPETAFLAPFSSVMVAHTGPGIVGLSWWWE